MFSPTNTETSLMSLCHSGDYKQRVSSLPSHTVSSWVEAPEMWCTLCWGVRKGASIVCLGWPLVPLRCLLQHSSRALLPFPLSPNPRKEHLPEYNEGGSVFKTLLSPSTFSTASCSFVTPSLCLCHLEYRVRIQGNEHAYDLSQQQLTLELCSAVLASIKKGKSAQLCNKEAQLGAQSSLCIQCSGNMEFAPTRKVTKLTLRLQRDQVSDVYEKE